MAFGKQVVITGIGTVNPLGCDIEKTWAFLLRGENGIVQMPDNIRTGQGCGTSLFAPAAGFDMKGFHAIDRHKKLLRSMDFVTEMLVYSGFSALCDAAVSIPEETERYNIGAVIGTGTALGYRYEGQPFEERNPKWLLDTYPNLSLAYLSILAGLKGYSSNIVSACASANQAIGHAYKMIQNGQADILLAGGAEDKFQMPFINGFSRLNMSTDSTDADIAMRPFDKKRNGFVIGQGACILVLESYEHAVKRGVVPKCRLVGYGASMNASSLTDASAEGIVRSMEMALNDARLSANDIGYINAHGSSTLSNDREESIAIKKLFGKRAYDIPVNSTKSMIGHTFAACGAIEAAVCVKSLQDQKVHITRNFDEGDSICDLDYVKGKSRDVEISYCLSNTSGIGGCNSTLIFGCI